MITAISEYEKLMTAWRGANTRVEALRAFQKNGGEFRLRIGADNGGDAVIANLMDGIMSENGGYRAILTTAIKQATHDAEVARQAFLKLAVNDRVGFDFAEAAQ